MNCCELRRGRGGASCEFDKTIGMGDGHVYSYLRGNEDPEVMEQIQIESEKAEKMLSVMFDDIFENGEEDDDGI